jgi:ribosomal protein S8
MSFYIKILQLLIYNYKHNKNQIIIKNYNKKVLTFLLFLIKSGYILSFTLKDNYYIVNLKYNSKGIPAISSLNIISKNKNVKFVKWNNNYLNQLVDGIFLTSKGFMDLKTFKFSNSSGVLLCVIY